MRMIFITFLTLISSTVFSYNGFDRMRCEGQLIEPGTSFEKVKQLCGDPLFEKEDKNDFRTFNYVTYKAEGGSSRYYLLFKNGDLIACHLQGYNTGDNIWINPTTLY